MDWFEDVDPYVLAALAFIAGAFVNAVLALIAREVSARQDEKRVVAREQRELLRTDRIRVVDDSARWFDAWTTWLMSPLERERPDPHALAFRRSAAVMGDEPLLREYYAVEGLLMRACGDPLPPAEQLRVWAVIRGVHAYLEAQRERAMRDQELVRVPPEVLASVFTDEARMDRLRELEEDIQAHEHPEDSSESSPSAAREPQATQA